MIIIVAGTAGSGKTTIGAQLADTVGWSFADADAFHPVANVQKMRSGRPLTDADRKPWLTGICAWMDERLGAAESAVVGCSALRRAYRRELLASRPAAHIAFLTISRGVAYDRLTARKGHFFTEKLLDSQFAELEPPHEGPQLALIDATLTPDQIVAEIIDRFGPEAMKAIQTQGDRSDERPG